jgi:hypothetical protein
VAIEEARHATASYRVEIERSVETGPAWNAGRGVVCLRAQQNETTLPRGGLVAGANLNLAIYMQRAGTMLLANPCPITSSPRHIA